MGFEVLSQHIRTYKNTEAESISSGSMEEEEDLTGRADIREREMDGGTMLQWGHELAETSKPAPRNKRKEADTRREDGEPSRRKREIL